MNSTVPLLLNNKSAVPREFNKIARRYDMATGFSQGYMYDLETSAALLEITENEIVMDLCCGTGKSSQVLLPYIDAGMIIGVDNSEDMLAEARKKFHRQIAGGTMRFIQNDAMQLEFADETFDKIFMAYGLRNMPDYDLCLEHLYRILKPGGRLVIHDYLLSDNRWSKYYWWVLGNLFILPFCTLLTGSPRIFSYLIKSVSRFLTPSQAENLLQRKGFTKIHTYAHKGWRKPILKAFVAEKPLAG